jgi:hypothetical protein
MAAGLSSRRNFIGGSDARIIMGTDEAALVRLWHEKRGEAAPARIGNRRAQSLLVRAQYRPAGRPRAAARSTFGDPLDGSHPRRNRRRGRDGIRGQIHAPLVLLG